MIKYNNVLEKLKAAGYTTTKIRNEKILSESTLTKIRNNQSISLETLGTICELTKLQPSDLIYYDFGKTLPDEIEAITEAKADIEPTISHSDINWD